MNKLARTIAGVSLGATLAACATAPAPSPAVAPAAPVARVPPPPQFRLMLPLRAAADLGIEQRVDVLMVHDVSVARRLEALPGKDWFAQRDTLLKEIGRNATPKALRIAPGQGGNYVFFAYEPVVEVVVFSDGAAVPVVRRAETVNYRLALTIAGQSLASAQ
jgi:hypothetical protein